MEKTIPTTAHKLGGDPPTEDEEAAKTDDALAAIVAADDASDDEEEDVVLPLWHRAAPISVFVFCVLVESLLVLWACGMFQPWNSRENDIQSMAFISKAFVEPYQRGLVRWYSGNATTMFQGRVMVVTYTLPLLSCEFLLLKDKYREAIAEAFGVSGAPEGARHLVPVTGHLERVRLVSPSVCLNSTTTGVPDTSKKITMHVTVFDVGPVIKKLELDVSASWAKDRANVNPSGQIQRGPPEYPGNDGPTAEKINYFLLKHRLQQLAALRITFLNASHQGGKPEDLVQNPVAGAPVTFVRMMFGGNSTRVLRCLWQPLASDWKDADCKYLDTGMFLSLWGFFVLPSVVTFAAILFLIGRHIREVSCSPADHAIPLRAALLKYSCYECGGREPTALYSPYRQQCVFATLLVICFLVLACGIWAMVGTEHWTLAMVRAADGVVASRALHTTLAASYGRDTAALKSEATAFFGARNRTYDEVTTWVRRDLTKLRAQVMQYRTKMRMLATFVEGCHGNLSSNATNASGSQRRAASVGVCDLRDANVWQRRNACVRRSVTVYNGSLGLRSAWYNGSWLVSNRSELEHVAGQAISYMPNFEKSQGVQVSPACSGGTCPCCEVCADTLTEIETVMAWMDAAIDQGMLEAVLKRPWSMDNLTLQVQRAVAPLDHAVGLVDTFTELLVKATEGVRTLERDTRTFRSLINHVGWGLSLLAIMFVPASFILGSPALNNCGLVAAFLALLSVWFWWAAMALFIVPSADICDLLLPGVVSNGSLMPGQLALPIVMGGGMNVTRRTQSDLLFYAGHLEPGHAYYNDDERQRWLDGRPNVTRAAAADFRKLFDSCVLDRQSVVWEAMAYAKSRIREPFSTWPVYDRVRLEDIQKHLYLADRLAPFTLRLEQVLASSDGRLRAALGVNETCLDPTAPLSGPGSCAQREAMREYQWQLDNLLADLRVEAGRVKLVALTAQSGANTLVATFGTMAADVNDFTNRFTDKLVYMAGCAPLTAAYEHVRVPLCDGARRAMDTMFIASFVAAVTLLPLVPLGLQGLKHARQRLRDARHPWLNVLVMFDLKHYRKVRYIRTKELERVRHLTAGGTQPDALSPSHAAKVADVRSQSLSGVGAGAGKAAYGEDLVLVEFGKGVDGWGHQPTKGNTPQHEIEPQLFAGHDVKYDFLDEHHIKGPAEAAGLHNSSVVSRLDTGNLYDSRDTRQLEVDARTGKLRWKTVDRRARRSMAVTVEAAALKLYSALTASGAHEGDREDLQTLITRLFRKIDEDGSGAVAKPELKAALQELGMEPTNAEVAKLMQTYDMSGEGLLDLPDFRSLILSAVELGAKYEKAKQASRGGAGTGKGSGGRGSKGSMLTTAGRRHPATQRVRWDAVKTGVDEEEEEEEKEDREWYPDEAYIRQLFRDLDTAGRGSLTVQGLRRIGFKLGLEWDESFARDIMLVVDASVVEEIDEDAFWQWYKDWSRLRTTARALQQEVSVGYTTAPTLTQLRRDRARLRLDSIGRSMQSQIERAITAASSGKSGPGAWGGGGWQNMDFAEGALVGGAGAQVKEGATEENVAV